MSSKYVLICIWKTTKGLAFHDGYWYSPDICQAFKVGGDKTLNTGDSAAAL